MSVALAVCKVTSDVVAVVATIAGVVNCIAMVLTTGLVSFMMNLGIFGCCAVAVVVVAVDVIGSTVLAVAGVLTIMVTAVVAAIFVSSGTVAEVMTADITVVVAGITMAAEVDITVVNCVEIPTVVAVWTEVITILKLGANVITEPSVVT